jgi:PAS domain S-box-containing protein
MEKTNILIVEDESIVAKEIKITLQELGYAVSGIVSSGKKAIEKVEESKPGLVLMDIKLKGEIDGIEAAGQINARYDIPIVYLTAYADERILERAKITEPFGYILKPFSDRELHSTIEIALYKHRMQQKLIDHAKWLSTTLTSLGDAVIATDEDGCVKFLNPVAQSLTGWTMEEASGRELTDILNIISSETREVIGNTVMKAIQEAAVVNMANSNVLLIDRYGKETPIEDSVAPIKYDKEDSVGAVLSFRDISQRKKMEIDTLRAQILESIGTLASGIAHDFNNLLTAILGNIMLTKMHTKLDDNGWESLIKAEKACDRAKNVTQRLLSFSKGAAPIKKAVAISEVLKNTVTHALSGTRVKCELAIPADLWWVEIDTGQVRQAFHNLLTNALEAMPKGGTVHVQAENITLDPTNSLSLKEGKYVKMTLKDNGCGISREQLVKIFDPYFTTKQSGRGLGLTSTYAIIKNHNGYISADSELGMGTTFFIYLPAAETIPKTKEKEPSKTTERKRKILVMDDDDIVREMCGNMCQWLGYEVELAEDGAQAIELYEKAREIGQPFDAVIVDLIITGGIGGKETIKILREIDPSVKAIVSSGYSDDPLMAEFEEYGFKGIIAKPYKIDGLKEVLQDVLTKPS